MSRSQIKISEHVSGPWRKGAVVGEQEGKREKEPMALEGDRPGSVPKMLLLVHICREQ